MPIPASPAGRSDVTSTVLRLFGQLHDQIREELTGLDDGGLNWSPGEGANTIATIVTHVLGSEAESSDAWRASRVFATVRESSSVGRDP